MVNLPVLKHPNLVVYKLSWSHSFCGINMRIVDSTAVEEVIK